MVMWEMSGSASAALAIGVAAAAILPGIQYAYRTTIKAHGNLQSFSTSEMDKASASGVGDSRFESWKDQLFHELLKSSSDLQSSEWSKGVLTSIAASMDFKEHDTIQGSLMDEDMGSQDKVLGQRHRALMYTEAPASSTIQDPAAMSTPSLLDDKSEGDFHKIGRAFEKS